MESEDAFMLVVELLVTFRWSELLLSDVKTEMEADGAVCVRNKKRDMTDFCLMCFFSLTNFNIYDQ